MTAIAMVPRRRALLACIVVLVATLTAGPALATADAHTGVDDPPTKNLCGTAGVDAAGSDIGVDDDPANKTLGDVVELPVSVPENGTATVVFEATGTDAYSRTIQLNDTSGDGTVTLQVNTF